MKFFSRYRISTLGVFYLLLTLSLSAQQQNVLRGKVTCEGRAIANVMVSDGFNCVRTNKDGSYNLISTCPSFVFISTPAGYLTKVENSIPAFYHRVYPGTKVYNFELLKNPKDDTKHVFLAQADVQLTDNDCLDTYKRMLPDCINLIRQEYAAQDVFGVDCGDIVGDTPALFPDYIKAVSVLDIPVYRAIGNHDMDYYGRSFETSYKTFEKYFGPTYYSFNKGKAHYIVLNNNFFLGREYFYMGYIDEKIFRWLEQDLAGVDKNSPVFVIMHIPSRLQEQQMPFEYNYSVIADQMVNAGAFHEILKPFDAHIISGHMHYNRNLVYSPKLMEHITGAVCGTWWRSDIGLDGTPRGYSVYEVDGTAVKWYYKSAEFPKEYQMRVYPVGSSPEFPDDLIVNVWNWDKNWKVEWVENGISRGEMTHYSGNDPLAEQRCADRQQMKYDWITINPTDHLFRATPQNKNSKIEIRVTDRFGKVYVSTI
jgi:hypothetical protein